MTETLQDRLRRAADDNSDHPPTFGLYFEAADRIDELEQAAKARADSDAEDDRRRQRDVDVRSATWYRYVDLKRQIRLLEGDHMAQRPLVADALALAKLHDFDIDREELAELKAERKAAALRSTGTLIAVGEIHVCENYEADPAERLLTMVSGLLIKADDEARSLPLLSCRHLPPGLTRNRVPLEICTKVWVCVNTSLRTSSTIEA